MKNNICKHSLLLVLLISLSILFSACEHFVDVNFVLKGETNDTITLIGWSNAYQNGVTNYTTPYTTNAGIQMEKVSISSFNAGGGPHVSVTNEQAFTQLMSDFDSVRITRSSDGASTIIYRHDDNATESQRFFFKREAWTCSPDDEGYEGSRTYTLKLTDDMFH